MKETTEQISNAINDKDLLASFDSMLANNTSLVYGDVSFTEAYQKFFHIKELLALSITNGSFDFLPINKRNAVLSNLEAIRSYINNPTQIIILVDSLYESMLGNDLLSQQINKRDYLKEFKKITELKDKLERFHKEIIDQEEILEKIPKIISDIESKKETLNVIYNSSEQSGANIQNIENKIIETQIAISNSNSNIKQIESELEIKKLSINTFSENIDEYKDLISGLEGRARDVISKDKQIEKLIYDAEIALNLKSAEGISAAFSAQYLSANNLFTLRTWIGGAIAFIIIAIILTVWIVSGEWIKDPSSLSSIVGRIVAVGIAVTGSTFCANQYTKQKNIAEDYAYKAVLAKSIVAFTDEIKKRDDLKVAEYLDKVLTEIHKDPLRKRDEKDEANISKKPLEIFEKLIDKMPTK